MTRAGALTIAHGGVRCHRVSRCCDAHAVARAAVLVFCDCSMAIELYAVKRIQTMTRWRLIRLSLDLLVKCSRTLQLAIDQRRFDVLYRGLLKAAELPIQPRIVVKARKVLRQLVRKAWTPR